MPTSDLIWRLPPAAPALGADEIHVWCACLDQPAATVSRIEKTLSFEERARIEEIHTALGRQRFIVGRGLRRLILSRYVRCAPRLLEFAESACGKPVLNAPGAGRQIAFNVAHSGAVALYAIAAPRQIGVDLEQLRSVEGSGVIARHFFSQREIRELRRLPRGEQIEAFFNCWTRKEAYLKAIDQNISEEPAPVEVSLAPGQPSRLVSINGDRAEAARWLIQPLAPLPGYVGALAVKTPISRVLCWMWSDGPAAAVFPGNFRARPGSQNN